MPVSSSLAVFQVSFVRKGGEHNGSRWARNCSQSCISWTSPRMLCLYLSMVVGAGKLPSSLSSEDEGKELALSFVLGREASPGAGWHRIFAVVFSVALLGCSWPMTLGSGYDRTVRETAMHCLLTQAPVFKRWMVFGNYSMWPSLYTWAKWDPGGLEDDFPKIRGNKCCEKAKDGFM